MQRTEFEGDGRQRFRKGLGGKEKRTGVEKKKTTIKQKLGEAKTHRGPETKQNKFQWGVGPGSEPKLACRASIKIRDSGI